MRNRKFIKKIINSIDKDQFWKPVKREKILRFKENKVKRKSGSFASGSCTGSEPMFRRIVSAARFQELNLCDILSYELTLVPAALFHEDGTMRKSTKSDLVKKLDSYADPDTDY